ncbi:MAG: hypothetical protein V9F04_00340 [Dermatophilaceae bacterium]
MSDITTQQRIGAQREAAQKVLAKKAEFHQHISKVRREQRSTWPRVTRARPRAR